MNARRRCAKPPTTGACKAISSRYAEQDRWEKLRVEAYDSGNHDMKELVWEVQRPVFIRMHQRLENMKGSLEDVYDFLVDEEAKDPSAGRPKIVLQNYQTRQPSSHRPTDPRARQVAERRRGCQAVRFLRQEADGPLRANGKASIRERRDARTRNVLDPPRQLPGIHPRFRDRYRMGPVKGRVLE